MADIQYLNYGDQQIEQQAFLDKAKKEVYNYVRKQPWSTKRKERFMSAYSDIMTRGVLGASIDDKTGIYKIQVGGDVMNISPDDQKIYGDAAAYLQEQMASLPKKASLEEEAKKKAEEEKAKFPIFDNKYFTTNFINHLSKNEFGGSKQFDTQNDWNGLDKRNEKTGLRGREERARILARNLQSYADSLDETKLNFEGSPFENLQDFKDRINKAVYALTETPDNIDDDNETLRRLGIRASDWFNNGSGDPSGQYINLGDGTKRELTYGELAQHNQEQENEKLATQKKTAYDNKLFFNRVTSPKMQGRSPVELKEKYKDNNSLLTALQGYAQQDIRSLTPDEISEVHGAYRNLAKVPIDSKLLSQLQNSANGLYVGSSPNRFKKINGIDNLIWDSIARQVIQINNRQQQQAIQTQPQDLFKGIKTKQEKEDEYFRNPNDGFTDADIRELSAIGLDLTAMFDPTRIYGTAAGLTASGLRTYNRWNDQDGFTLSDLGTSALDIGLNGVQWIPGVGNVANGAKGILSLAKFAPKIGRLIGRLGAAGGLIYGVSGLPEVWNKIDFAHPIDTAKRLTVEDWRKLSALMAGIKGTRDLNVTNRAARRVLEQNNVQISNRWSDKTGLTRTKIESEISTPTVKMKVGEKEVNIPIDKNLRKNLGKKFNKKGNNPEERSKVAREDAELQKAAEKAGIKVKDKDGNLTEEWKNASVTYEPSWRDKTFFKKQIPGIAKNFGTFGTSTSSASNVGNPQKFQEYLNKRGLLDKAWYGSNTTLGRINKNFQKNGIYGTGKTEQQSETIETPKATETPETTKAKPLTSKEIKELKENIKEFNKYTEGTAKHSGNHLSEEPFKAGDFDFEVNKFPNSSAGNIDISFNGKVMKSISFDNQKDMMKKVANFLKENRKLKDASGVFIKKFNAEKMGEILRQLKAKGVFKQGGRIDKQKIQKYKEFINK